jgi:hypothetical protein
MPINYHYDGEKEILFGEIKSPLSIEDFRTTMDYLLKSDEIPSDVSTVWDLRNLDFTAIDHDFMMQLIGIREKNPQRGTAKIAFVVTDDFAFGMVRMYEGHSAHLPQKTMVFQNYARALKWLLE